MAADALFEVELAGGHATRAYRKLVGDLQADYPWDTLEPEAYPADLVERARIGWTENAFNEFTTGVVMGQLLQAYGEANVPLDLCGIAASFPLEELVHVELCGRVAMRLGGGVPIVYDPDALTMELDPDLTPLQRANELTIRLCCVGEVFSLPMLAGAMKAASHPLTKAVLHTIVRDEAAHGHLGWLYLDWIGADLDRVERARLRAAAEDTAAQMSEIWRRLRVADTPDPHEIALMNQMGWMAPEHYVHLAKETMAVEVLERLATYGI